MNQLTSNQRTRIRRLAARGMGLWDICRLVGCQPADVRPFLDPERDVLEATARRLLAAPPPAYWQQGRAAWERCVRMNFADVLEEATAEH